MAISKWFNEEYITWLTKLETSLIYSTVDGYSVSGSSRNLTSYADVMIWNLIKETFRAPEYASKAAEALLKSGASKIIKISDRVHDMKAVKEWIDSRPQTMF